MNRHSLRVTMFLILSAASLSRATADMPKIDCDSPSSTYEINSCLAAQSEKVEVRLNDTYQRVMRALSGPDTREAQFTRAKKSLIEAQRAWIKYRDKDCDAIYALGIGGSMRVQSSLSCMQNRAEQRIMELEQYLEP